MEISFLYPKFLLLLLLIPTFILIYFSSTLYNKKKSIIFPNFDALARISDVEIFSRNFAALYLNIIILALLVLGISGTVISFETQTSSFSYVFVVDNSVSMETPDIFPNRLEAAKNFAKDFIDELPLVEIGVIAFSGDAVIMHELDSFKLKTKMAVDNIDFGEIQGTNVHNALMSANKIFETRKMKAVILISDGQLNVKEASKIVTYAQRRNIIIHTVAVGTEAGGETVFNTISKVDEDFLKSLSFNTGGKFFRVQDKEGFDEAVFEFSEGTDNIVSLDISTYLFFTSLVLMLLSWILYNFRFKTIP